MGIVYFLAVVVIMWPTAPWIFKMMGHPPTVVGMEVIYLRIMLYAHIIAVINWSSSQFFMGIHRPIITMCASLCGQVVNVTANYVLIFGKFGFPAMGFSKMYDLLKVGLPAGFGLMVNVAFWGVVLFGLVGKFGTESSAATSLAATSAVLAYTNLSVMPVVGISMALAAAVGKTIGQGQKKDSD